MVAGWSATSTWAKPERWHVVDPVTFKMAMQLLWSLLKTKKGRKLVAAVIGTVVLGLAAAIGSWRG